MISKKKIALIIIGIVIMLSFKVFQLTPIGNIATMISMVLGGVGYGQLIIHFRKFPKALRRFGMVFLVMYITSILSTYLIHAQPILSGVIASSTIFFVGMVFIAYYQVLRHNISLDDIKKLTVQISWALFVGYLFLYFFNIEFSSSNNDDIFGVGLLQKGVVNFGVMIYLVSFFKHGKGQHLLFSILLFSVNHLTDFQRYILAQYNSENLGAAMVFTTIRMSEISIESRKATL